MEDSLDTVLMRIHADVKLALVLKAAEMQQVQEALQKTNERVQRLTDDMPSYMADLLRWYKPLFTLVRRLCREAGSSYGDNTEAIVRWAEERNQTSSP
jgi:hypothetical protein